MRCKMKAMIMGHVHFIPQNTVFLMFGHVVDVGAGKRRGLPIMLWYGMLCCVILCMYVCYVVLFYVCMYVMLSNVYNVT